MVITAWDISGFKQYACPVLLNRWILSATTLLGDVNDVPVPAKIEVEGGATVTLTWEDGSVSTLTAARLRAACPCATCREPTGEEATRLVLTGLDPVVIQGAALVGAYAINFVFGPDAHSTGIFPFAELRRIEDTDSDS